MEEKKKKKFFSVEDQLLLLDLILKEKDIIENKITNKLTNEEKDKTWQNICSSFNSSTYHPRSVDQLKTKFDNLKTKAKKVVAARGTAGVQISDPIVETTLKIMNSKQMVGLHTEFDCDSVDDVKIEIVPSELDPTDSVCLLINNELEMISQKNQSEFPVEIKQDNRVLHSPQFLNSLEEEVSEGPVEKNPEKWSSHNRRNLKLVSRNPRTQVRKPLSLTKEAYYRKKKEILENEDRRRQEEHEAKLQLMQLQILELKKKLNEQ
ncbi:uncharacterized protein LOC123679785 [Harmonia axyridis]|uniref:uncharacterized protein LOC123679785 n=1 Tax=Harmonia axyridis TaxID=115357 RepID=UPI001E276475|nr:uncharacterized protein LOC123679785 [Harmonia axyridis]